MIFSHKDSVLINYKNGISFVHKFPSPSFHCFLSLSLALLLMFVLEKQKQDEWGILWNKLVVIFSHFPSVQSGNQPAVVTMSLSILSEHWCQSTATALRSFNLSFFFSLSLSLMVCAHSRSLIHIVDDAYMNNGCMLVNTWKKKRKRRSMRQRDPL